MNKTEALKDTRTSFRAFAAAVGALGSYVAVAVWGIEAEGVALGMAVYMAGVGFGEALFDHRSTQ